MSTSALRTTPRRLTTLVLPLVSVTSFMMVTCIPRSS